MALLYVSEYEAMGHERRGILVPAPKEPALLDQTPIDFTAGEVKSAVFSEGCRYVLLTADADCHIAFGSNPTATTSHKPLWAKMYAGFAVDQMANFKVSVIGA